MEEIREQDAYVDVALERIATHSEQRLRIETLAEEMGVSASYLSRRFKAVTGQTFLDTLNMQRVQQAVGEIFVAEEKDGSIDITFKFDSFALAGKSLVAFESLTTEGKEVAVLQQFLFPVHYDKYNTGRHRCHNGIYGILKHPRRHDSQNDISGRSTSHGCHHAQNADPENIHSSLCSYHCSGSSECNRSRHFQNKCK